MRCLKAVFFALAVVMIFAPLSYASLVPAHADAGYEFEISAEGLIYNPMPWDSPRTGNVVSATLFTIDSYAPSPTDGKIKEYNLGFVEFANHDYSLLPYGQGKATGDLAIKYYNRSGQDREFDESILTVHFTTGTMDIYLPGFDIALGGEVQFWVASDGSTYFKDPTASGMVTAQQSIDNGNVARVVPEPATLMMLGFGAIYLCRRKTS